MSNSPEELFVVFTEQRAEVGFVKNIAFTTPHESVAKNLVVSFSKRSRSWYEIYTLTVATEQEAEADVTLISLSYTEGHPDRDRTFLGFFSSEDKAKLAMNEHMKAEQTRLPSSYIAECHYTFDEAVLDEGA